MRSYSGRNSQWDEAVEGRWPGGLEGHRRASRAISVLLGLDHRGLSKPAAQAAADTESTDDQRSLLTKASA